MDRRVMRERMRRKQRQIRRRKIIKLVTYVVAMVLAIVFVIRGIIFPIINRIGGGSTGNSQAIVNFDVFNRNRKWSDEDITLLTILLSLIHI